MATPENQSDIYLPATKVMARYHIVPMTLYRWIRDAEKGFPAPVYFGARRYWRIADLEAWEAAQSSQKAA